MAQPASLLSLPDETLISILKYYLTGQATDLRTRTAGYANPSGPWAVGRQALWAVSLSNRRLSRLANPFLYRHIFVWDGKTLAQLFHTLLHAPHIRPLMRTFALVARMDSSAFDARCWTAFTQRNWEIETLPPMEQRIFDLGMCAELASCPRGERVWLAEAYREWSALSQSILGGILCLLPAITALHLQITDRERYWGCTRIETQPYADLEEILDLAFNDTVVRPHVLPSMQRLRLVSNPDRPNEELGMEWILRLVRFPTEGVKKIDLLADRWQAGYATRERFEWANCFSEEEAPDLNIDPQSFRSVESIRAQFSDTSGRGWHDLLAICPKLKALNLDVAPRIGTPCYFYYDYCDEEGNEQPGSLDSALLQRRDTLEVLRISAGTRQLRREELVELGWLSCLPKMDQLSTLRVDLNLLFQEPRLLATKDPKTFLPPRLRYLTILEVWGPEEEGEILASDDAMRQYGVKVGLAIDRILAAKMGWLGILETFDWWQRWSHWRAGFDAPAERELSSHVGGVAFTVRDTRGVMLLS